MSAAALPPHPGAGPRRSGAALLALLAAPWAWLRNQNTPAALRLYGAFGCVLVAGPAMAALWWLPPRVAAIALAVLGGIGLLVVWGWQFGALMRLDHPHAARLVPGHSQALRRTALGLWLGLMTLCGLVALVAATVITGSLQGAGWQSVALAMLGAGAAMLFVALALRWWLLWNLLWLLPAAGGVPGVKAVNRAGLAWAQHQWSVEPVVSTVLLGLAMALALAALFGHGNAAHGRAHAARERMRRITLAGSTGQQPTLAAYGRWGEVLGAPWQRLHDGWLARVSQRAQATTGSVMARAEVVLSGAQHWVRHLGVVAPLLLGLVLVFAAIGLHGSVNMARILEHGHVGMSIGLMSMTLSPLMSLPGALWISRREQALLVLLPGMPRGAALNHALAWRQARQFLQMWLLTLPVFAALAWLGPAPQVLAFPVVALAVLPWLWRDVARRREPRGMLAALPFVLALALAMASMLLLRSYRLALLPWLLGVLVVALGAGVWRWRWLARLPQALPAGRLAGIRTALTPALSRGERG